MQFERKVELTEDDWLQSIMGLPCYRMDISDKKESRFVDNFSKSGFFHTRIEIQNNKLIEYVIRKGFFISSIDIKFECTHDTIDVSNTMECSVNIVEAEPHMKSDVGELAERCFSKSRFHKDPLIQNSVANRIKRLWSESYFNGTRGTHMYVAIVDEKIVGFNQLILNGDVLTIDLICVDDVVRGQGIGKALISTATRDIDAKTILVGTQLDNISSLRFYGKLGFELMSSSIACHYHSDQNL